MALRQRVDDMSAFREIALQAGVPHEALDDTVYDIPLYQPANQAPASGEGDDHTLDSVHGLGWPNG